MSTVPTIADIAAKLNQAAKGHAVGALQDLRQQSRSLSRKSTNSLFDWRTTFETYAFHVGGRTELQFNIGFEQESRFRYGVAFSLERSQALSDIETLRPNVKRFNDYVRQYPDDFDDMRMWHIHRGVRSTDYCASRIPDEIFLPQTFIFLGTHQPSINEVRPEEILEAFDRLLPLYRYVQGIDLEPVQTNASAAFTFRPGCSVKPSRTTATPPTFELDVYLRHNELQSALYESLSQRYGSNFVGAEQPNGQGGRIDIAVRIDDRYWFYEIKTASTARGCVREAIAQLLEYSFWPEAQKADRLIVVGEALLDGRTARFLETLRNDFAMPIFYEQFTLPAS